MMMNSIFIFREVVPTAYDPVLLYSIGKDSGVLLHLAIKAFYPAPLPFPLLHVDTTWKFREMIEFRDKLTKDHLGCGNAIDFWPTNAGARPLRFDECPNP